MNEVDVTMGVGVEEKQGGLQHEDGAALEEEATAEQLPQPVSTVAVPEVRVRPCLEWGWDLG